MYTSAKYLTYPHKRRIYYLYITVFFLYFLKILFVNSKCPQIEIVWRPMHLLMSSSSITKTA